MSRSTGETRPSGVKGIRYDSQFSRIEELIEGNTFSSEEISHLVEVLNSRLETESEKNSDGVDAKHVSWMHEVPSTPTAEEQQDLDGKTVGTFLERTDVPVGVGASPIDIARSYMANRTSDRARGLYGFTPKGEITHPNHENLHNSLIQSPFLKPSTCWPGAIVQNHGYAMPKSLRGYFPGTPYSRATLSKSTTKLQAETRCPNTSTPFQQSQTSIYGLERSRGETVRGYGSVGPIRRIRNKFASEVRPRGSIFRSSSNEVPLNVVKPNVFQGFLPNAEKNLEPGETSGTSKNYSGDNLSGSPDRGYPNPNSTSSQAIKKILEHLDRNKPTPKQKEAELKLATSWRNSSVTQEENFSSQLFGDHSSRKITDLSCLNVPMEFNKSGSRSIDLPVFQERGADMSKDSANEKSKGSSSVFADSSRIPAANPMLSFGLKGNSNPVFSNLHENAIITNNHGSKGTSPCVALPHLSNGQDVKSAGSPTGSELSKSHGMKPVLPSICVKKRDPRAVSSDTGFGFTFPVSTSSGGFSEPPTPSITPSTSVSILSQPQAVVPTVPSYEFGAKKSTPRLVFSLPFTSNASIPEASDLKFSFGSEEKTRLSFSSFGKNAICY